MNKNENLITKTTKRVKGKWFEHFFEKLVEYKEKHGNFYGVTQDPEIGVLVHGIRCAYKGIGTRKLTSEMIEKLNSIGFSWEADINDYYAKWFPEFYEKVVAYKAKHGTFYGITTDKEIGWQVINVRKAYKGKDGPKLTQEMIEKLESIDFPWVAEKTDWFTPFYEKVVAYKEKYGTFKGIIIDKEIGTTVSNIRCAYKGMGRTKLTQEMIEKLNSIGFPWQADKNEYQAKWFSEFYEKVVAYKAKHGTFYGITTDKEIGHKVGSVRCAYKGKGVTKLTQEMIDKLNEIGFSWEAEYGSWFDSFYEKVVAYKEKHGTFKGITADKEIGLQVCGVRSAYKGKGGTKLTQEMINKLNSIGFPWSAKSKQVKEDDLTI